MLLALLAFGTAVASAEPVQQFGVQLKNVTSDGRFSVSFTSDSFDTTGAPPPVLTDASVRFPRGISIKPQFLRRERLCQTGKLRLVLLARETPARPYGEMLDDLAATQRRIGRQLTPGGLRVLDTCRKAFIGRGTFIVDARPLYAEPIPGLVHLFLSRPTAKGAVAGFGVMSLYDRSSPVVPEQRVIADLQPVFTLNAFDEPTPDGRYGYRVKLLPEKAGIFKFSLAQLQVQSRGIVAGTQERTCTARRNGRCVRYRVRRTSDFWANQPACPTSGKLPFKASYRYQTGLSSSTFIEVPCPRFTR